MWSEDDRSAILLKTNSSGIVVVEFVDEYVDYLRITPEQHTIARRIHLKP